MSDSVEKRFETDIHTYREGLKDVSLLAKVSEGKVLLVRCGLSGPA